MWLQLRLMGSAFGDCGWEYGLLSTSPACGAAPKLVPEATDGVPGTNLGT
jgi:hypothetical protein